MRDEPEHGGVISVSDEAPVVGDCERWGPSPMDCGEEVFDPSADRRGGSTGKPVCLGLWC